MLVEVTRGVQMIVMCRLVMSMQILDRCCICVCARVRVFFQLSVREMLSLWQTLSTIWDRRIMYV